MSKSIVIPNHTVSNFAEADLLTIAKHLRESKLELAINRFLFKDWPNEEAQTANYNRAIESGFKNPDSEKLKVVDDTTGKIVAHLVVTHKKPSKENKKATGGDPDAPPPVPDYFNSEILNWVITASSGIEEVVKDIEYLGNFPC
jgi:hypothetical protein